MSLLTNLTNPYNNNIYLRNLTLCKGFESEPSLTFRDDTKKGLYLGDDNLSLVSDGKKRLSINDEWTNLRLFREGEFSPEYSLGIEDKSLKKFKFRKINDRVDLTLFFNIMNRNENEILNFTVSNLPEEIRPNLAQAFLVSSLSSSTFSGMCRVVVYKNQIIVNFEALNVGKTGELAENAVFQAGPTTISYMI